MPMNGSRDDDRVNAGIIQDTPNVFYDTGTFTLSLLGDFQRRFDHILIDVADVGEVDIRHLTEEMCQPLASASDSHHGQSHFVVGRCSGPSVTR